MEPVSLSMAEIAVRIILMNVRQVQNEALAYSMQSIFYHSYDDDWDYDYWSNVSKIQNSIHMTSEKMCTPPP